MRQCLGASGLLPVLRTNGYEAYATGAGLPEVGSLGGAGKQLVGAGGEVTSCVDLGGRAIA